MESMCSLGMAIAVKVYCGQGWSGTIVENHRAVWVTDAQGHSQSIALAMILERCQAVQVPAWKPGF